MPLPTSPVVIAGTGSYAPDRILSNEELSRMVDTSDDWIRERTGIRERRIAAPGEAASDLACRAAAAALADAALPPSEVDWVIVATMTPDSLAPSTACLVQDRLGLSRAAAFDLNAACSGFLYALEVGSALASSRRQGNVLVVGAEKLSSFLDWSDRTTCVLFGDGAGAVLLRTDATAGDRGVLGARLCSNGAAADLLHVPAGGSRLPTSTETIAARQHFLRMRGKEVFKAAVRSMEEVALELLGEHGFTPADLDLVVPHQANQRIIDALASYLDLPAGRLFVNLDRYGNTSAASVPIALDEAARSGRLRRGNLCLLLGFGAGFTWGATLVRW